MDALRIQARFVVVSPHQVYHPGQIVVRHGRIVEVARSSTQKADIDLHDSALLPGLINAHTHLEFSDLQHPFPPGASFPDWIGSVVQHRRTSQADSTPTECAQARATSIDQGLREAHATGTFFLGDIVTPPWRPDMLPSTDFSPPNGMESENGDTANAELTEAFWDLHLARWARPGTMLFPEVIGLQAARFEESCDWALRLAAAATTAPMDAIGISPHAPYSLALSSLEALFRRLPAMTTVAMHVAESRAELEWLERGSGPFLAAFERLDVPLVSDRPQIEDCIRLLSAAHRGLLVHGNYLTEQQIASIAHAQRVSVVYCPRTHAHFGHASYPLKQLQAAGVRIVLGTDSRASNPDLNLWKEVVEMRRQHAWLSPESALAAATSASAAALGIESSLGTLETGKLAAVCVVPCQPHWKSSDVLEAITGSDPTDLPIQPLSWKAVNARFS